MQPLSDSEEMVQTGHDCNRPLQSTVDLSEDLNQQTYMVGGQLQVQEDDVSTGVDVKDGDAEGHDCVDDGEGNTERSQEAFADVAPLEKHQGPVEQTFSSQTEQDGGDGDKHGMYHGVLWVIMGGRLCCCVMM